MQRFGKVLIVLGVIAALLAIVGKNLKPRHKAEARKLLDQLARDAD